MRRGVWIAWAIGVLVIVALFAFTMGPRHAAPPRSETSSAPPPKNPPMTSPEAPTAPPPPAGARAQDLPPSLEPLCYRSALPVRPDPDFQPDILRLVAALREIGSAA